MIQSILKTENYDEELLYGQICRHFDILGIKDEISPDMKVVIKPNFVMACRPQMAATTHPLMLKAVVRWLREHDIQNVTIAESPGGLYTAEHLKKVYSMCGVTGIGIDDVLNYDVHAGLVSTEESFANPAFNIIDPVRNADYIINMPKLKTHGMIGFSCGMKNLFGVIPGLEKPQLHYRWPDINDFSRMIFELDRTVAPDLTVVDAIECMEGNGPTGGDKKYFGYTFASKDMYTQDYYIAGRIGINPDDIEMIKQAKKAGYVREEDIEFAGDMDIAEPVPFKIPDTKRLDFVDRVPAFLSRPAAFVMKKLLRSYPQADKNLCVGCGKCLESCPPHIIKIKNKKAHFTRKGCISCFCCQEMCPMKAISVKKVFRL